MLCRCARARTTAPCGHRFQRILRPSSYLLLLLVSGLAHWYTSSLVLSSAAEDDSKRLHIVRFATFVSTTLAFGDFKFAAERRPKLSIAVKTIGIAIALAGTCALQCVYGSHGVGCDFKGFLTTPAQPDEVCYDARNAVAAYAALAILWFSQLFTYLRVLRAEKRHNAAQASKTVEIVVSDTEKGDVLVAPAVASAKPTPFCARCALKSKWSARLLKHASSPRRMAFHALSTPIHAALYALFCGWSVISLYRNDKAMGASLRDRRYVLAVDVGGLFVFSVLEAIVAFKARKDLDTKRVPGSGFKVARMVFYLKTAGFVWGTWGKQLECDAEMLFVSGVNQACEMAGTTIFFLLLGVVVEGSMWGKQAWIRRKVVKLRAAQEEGSIALPVTKDEPLVVVTVIEG